MPRALLISAFLLISNSIILAAPQTQPAIPASAENSPQALKDSPRHGEWDDVPLPGSDVKIKTWVVYPERADKAPVVLVVHEIFGMSDWVRAVTDQLAAEGYLAVAPDMLSGMGLGGGGTESLGDNVGATIRKLTPAEEARRLDAVRDYAIALPSASDKTAVIGFCWGGGVSFAYATHQPKLSAAIVYYGTPPKPDAMAAIHCPVLGCYGKDDGRITLTVPNTIQLMNGLKKDYQPHVYDGAGHGFLRQQSQRNGANLAASQQAWAETLVFLKKNLEGN